MRPFGCLVTILNTLDSLSKFDGKVDEGFLVGYSVSSKAFRVFNSRTRIVQETLHINFLENKPNVAGSSPTWLFDIDTLTRTMNYQTVTAGNQSNPSTGVQEQFNIKKMGRKMSNNMCFFLYGLLVLKLLKTLMEMLPLKKKSLSLKEGSLKFKDFFNNNINEVNAAGNPIPAVGQIFTDNTNTFSAAELEDITYFDDEEDKEGIDYEKVFAPVARIEAIRLFLAYASFMGFMVYQMDVKSAFLYGTIKEEVYVCQPPGFKDPDYHDKIYVDDIIFGSTNKDLCKAFEKLIKDKFQMSLMGELTFFLDKKVKQKLDGIFISHDIYVAEILRKFGLTYGKSASTSIDTEKPLIKDPDGEDVDLHTYRSMIGSLMYLTSSRPNIMFAVYACAHFQEVYNSGMSIPWMQINFLATQKSTVVATSSIEAEYVAAEVILNGDSLVPTRIVEEVVQPVAPITAEQKLARKNELKARSTLVTPLFVKKTLCHNLGVISKHS
nr:hypothetical protein [Tanacetum cinerariifolium]